MSDTAQGVAMKERTDTERQLERIPGWDERDYALWSAIEQLPSYGLLGNKDKMISSKSVISLLESMARARS